MDAQRQDETSEKNVEVLLFNFLKALLEEQKEFQKK